MQHAGIGQQQDTSSLTQPAPIPAWVNWALYVKQWGVLLLVVAPLICASLAASLPIALLLIASGAVRRGEQLAVERDPLLAKVLQIDSERKRGGAALLAGCGRCFISLVMFGLHHTLRTVFVVLARPRTVFVVYSSNYSLMSRFFCIGTAELIVRAGLSKQTALPQDTPWVFMVGLIHGGPDVGFGVYGCMLPTLSHVTPQHLRRLPASFTAAFPHAQCIALAGRLPGLMTAAGMPIRAPLVDGLAGTVFAMEATIRALVERLPAERRACPTVAILGGGGFIGSRLTSVLAVQPQHEQEAAIAAAAAAAAAAPAAVKQHGPAGRVVSLLVLESQSSFNLDLEPQAARVVRSSLLSLGSGGGLSRRSASRRPVGMTATVTLRGAAATAAAAAAAHAGPAAAVTAGGFKRIIALDTRYEGNRHARGGVLYTAEASDLEAADVVLVITRNGDDVADYVQHAQPGQEWADDTHPEITRALLQQLAARGVSIHKAMATRSPPTALVPPLPGWPLAGTPGCLLMALVGAATRRDWNGAGMGLCAGGAAARSDRYWDFTEATRRLGFRAMLTAHRRSKVDGL